MAASCDPAAAISHKSGTRRAAYGGASRLRLLPASLLGLPAGRLRGVAMTQTAEATDRYVRDFDALCEQRAEEPIWLRDLPREGFDSFQRMGWPIGEKRDEMWKYTDVRPVARTGFRSPDAFGTTLSDRDIAALVPFAEGMSRLVFIDGHYAPH